MPKALIVTVGGADIPVVQLIRHYKEKIDFIYFICSAGEMNVASTRDVDGSGKINSKPPLICPKCKGIVSEGFKGRENIITQSGYKGKYKKVEIDNPDSFNEVFSKTKATIREAKKEGYEIVADFTGGTKTMSSVLAMLSVLDYDCLASLVVGPRKDKEKVDAEVKSIPVVLDTNGVRVDFLLKTADVFISKRLYHSATIFLRDLLQKRLREDCAEKIRRKLYICEVFFCWDRFEYEDAYNNLRNFTAEYRQPFDYLLKILDKSANSGYERVFDLLANARRQADNGNYDNAVSRVYRAVELFAQTRLKKEYQIDTAVLEKSLDRTKDREKWEKKKDREGKIKIGLIEDYELLLELEDEVGKSYGLNKNSFIDKLKIRNISKLAHGDIPVSEGEWEKFIGYFQGFIGDCCEKINVQPDFSFNLPDKI